MKKVLMQGPRLETIACSLCAGTGQRVAIECPRCDGAGAFLTKRGAVARSHMKTLVEKPCASVVVGDAVWFPVGTGKVAATVLRVELDYGPCRRVRLHGKRRKTGDDIAFAVDKLGVVELAHTPHELEQIRAQVEAYQDTLTKNGDVASRPGSLHRVIRLAA